jgi:cbb3-type cytochrome oxidase subunit 3
MMNFDISLTIILFIIFIGIIVWAWSPARRQDFNDAAHLAVDDDIDDDNSNNVPEADRHG